MSPPLVEDRQGKNRPAKRGKRKPSHKEVSSTTFKSGSFTTTGLNETSQRSAPRNVSHGQKKESGNDLLSQSPRDKHLTSQTTLTPDRRTTPSKQAYAGPTFHSSPAASSLPMPSFYSKSLPAVVASPPVAKAHPNGQSHVSSHPATNGAGGDVDSTGRPKDPSPLEFMFEAARRAKQSPDQSTDRRLGRASPFAEPVGHGARGGARATSSESVFPFELDGNGGSTVSLGPAFATPYKDRIAALQSSRSQTAASNQGMDEKECREKSEALKRLLSNASPSRSASDPTIKHHHAIDQILQDRSRHPNFGQPAFPQAEPPVVNGVDPKEQHALQRQHSDQLVTKRPISSHLRHEYQPDRLLQHQHENNHHQEDCNTTLSQVKSGMMTPSKVSESISNARAYNAHNNNVAQERSPLPNNTAAKFSGRQPALPPSPPIYSALKMEDDLRRVLKLGPHGNAETSAT